MGKGDKRRPMNISKEEYSSNWDLIFKKKPANLSFSEQVLNKDSKFETRVGALFHPEDPKLSNKDKDVKPKEIGGRDGPEPTRYNDWEKSGRCIDF